MLASYHSLYGARAENATMDAQTAWRRRWEWAGERSTSHESATFWCGVCEWSPRNVSHKTTSTSRVSEDRRHR